ncbi:hypothetical protein PILCRDRAFT_812717 [Piloderma croceum F 1598]|uniref:F-box domain-containing protein n=1 Tax=Piloderma croceum (strain F 1598) TaxID=765440 RepID=A0A0C3GE14_PILCF|nr:hypothetical protein PILCRDRAFT_812717 [Piloderma croceum F 1598]
MIQNNCGSITPAILRSFIPHLRPRVRSVSLGLSYSLTDDDVFAFLNELPELTSVELQYYLQLKIPAPTLSLPHIGSFTAKYAQPHTRDEANHFCVWVRRAISSSHRLRILRLIGDHVKSNPSVSFDGLISHMTARHFRTLRVLDLGTAFIGGDAFKQLCATCTILEDLTAGVGWPTAVIRDHILCLLSVCRRSDSDPVSWISAQGATRLQCPAFIPFLLTSRMSNVAKST